MCVSALTVEEFHHSPALSATAPIAADAPWFGATPSFPTTTGIDATVITEPAPDITTEKIPTDVTAPLYKVLIHNDDVTPLDYVIRILQRIFMLSQELAEHVAETAHNEEVAIVVIRPRTEAEKLVGAARLQARADGYPLTFSLEPDE
jgi:ATP-dependent Clp protease adaptor protein ClpS